MEVSSFIPGEPGSMSERHMQMLENFRKTKAENRKKVLDLYESKKDEFDALADKLGPADSAISDIKVGTEADLSGVPADRIITITLDMSADNLKKMLATGELKRGREWTQEDIDTRNALCACGCGKRSPFPAVGEWLPEDWKPDDAERLFVCSDSVLPGGDLENRHQGHKLSTKMD
jgi:hypothetical protein